MKSIVEIFDDLKEIDDFIEKERNKIFDKYGTEEYDYSILDMELDFIKQRKEILYEIVKARNLC
jgi:hypothetical protein